MKIRLCLLATFCVLISSCRKEGPLGFKTGQEYIYGTGDTVWEVVDVGKDWVEFEKENGDRSRKTKAWLEKYLHYFKEE